MIFAKFQFETAAQFRAAVVAAGVAVVDGNDKLQAVGCTVVELGNIVISPAVLNELLEEITPAVVSEHWHVDVLFGEGYEDVPASLLTHEVFPDPYGVHVFSGAEHLYVARRLAHMSSE